MLGETVSRKKPTEFTPETATPEQIRLLLVLLESHARDEADMIGRLATFEARLAVVERAVGASPKTLVTCEDPPTFAGQRLAGLMRRLALVEECRRAGCK